MRGTARELHSVGGKVADDRQREGSERERENAGGVDSHDELQARHAGGARPG